MNSLSELIKEKDEIEKNIRKLHENELNTKESIINFNFELDNEYINLKIIKELIYINNIRNELKRKINI